MQTVVRSSSNGPQSVLNRSSKQMANTGKRCVITDNEIELAARLWEDGSRLPTLLAGLVVLLGVAAVGNALVNSVRKRRRDLAILRTIGLVRRQVAAVVAWQATLLSSWPCFWAFRSAWPAAGGPGAWWPRALARCHPHGSDVGHRLRDTCCVALGQCHRGVAGVDGGSGSAGSRDAQRVDRANRWGPTSGLHQTRIQAPVTTRAWPPLSATRLPEVEVRALPRSPEPGRTRSTTSSGEHPWNLTRRVHPRNFEVRAVMSRRCEHVRCRLRPPNFVTPHRAPVARRPCEPSRPSQPGRSDQAVFREHWCGAVGLFCGPLGRESDLSANHKRR